MKTRKKVYLSTTNVSILALLLSACGGGTGSGSNQNVDGTYAGNGSITFDGGGLSATREGGFTVTIEADGTVTYREEGVVLGTTNLNGNQFTIILPASRFNEANVNCNGTIRLDAGVSGDSINGTVSSDNMRCNQTNVMVSGTISARRTI